MKKTNKILAYISFMFIFMFFMSTNSFARLNNEIEVYKMGDNSITIKWTPYDGGGQTLDKYTIGYKVDGDAAYTYINVDASLQSADYNMINNEFIKKISGLQTGTVYDITLDVYIGGSPVAGAYNPIMTMTKIVIDKSIQTFNNPYGNDDVGHIDFAFNAPNESVGGVLSSINQSNIDGYKILASDSQGQIYSSGHPFKVLYDGVTGKYKIYKVTTIDEPLTYSGTQFEFSPQVNNGKDMLSFSLYKTNQPSVDNFKLATVYYVTIQPIFKVGSGFENVIVNATGNFETIENIATLLPVTATQISNDLVKVQFPQVGSGSMSYDIYRGRVSGSLTKIHTEYDDGTSGNILYYNKLIDAIDGDVYYYQIKVSGAEIKSKEISITVSLNPNIAPIIKNIQIEKIITDKVTNTADVIISWDKPDNEDTYKNDLLYRIYLNTDNANQVYDNDVVYDAFGNILLDQNGKAVLNTKTDINNNKILYNGNPVVFERVVELSPTNLTGSVTVYSGSDPIGNFITTGQNYYKILRNNKEVIRTLYRVNGADFLQNIDVPQILGQPHTIYDSNLEGELATDYKNSIDLNTIYFLKMDSYNNMISQTSDYSITVSFTTPKDIVDTVAVPDNFAAETIETDKIGLVWDILSNSTYNDNDVTYEIFMSENGSYNDADFHRLNNPTITTTTNKKHLLIDVNYTFDDLVPKQIEPNKTYLFKIRTKWNTQDDKGNNVTLYSTLSNIVPVTTKRTPLLDPDINAPLAPTDFTTSEISSKSSSFQWTQVDSNSTYRIVKTSEEIAPFAPLSLTGNGVTTGFVNNNGIYTYSDPSLNANTLYYFSIRSETIVGTQTLVSPWITIPVTTKLLEEPTELNLVSRNKDGHSITLSWKGKANLDYQIVKKDDATKNYSLAATASGDVNQSGDKTFEIVLDGLESNTQYLIKVRAKDISSNMFSKYCLPIMIRTEFNQEDYSKNVEEEEKTNIISKVAQEWIDSPIEEIGDDENKQEIWIKEGKSTEEVKNSPNMNYVINLDNGSVKNKSVYIPLDLIGTLQDKVNTLEIKIPEGNIYIKPGLLDSRKLSEKLDYEYVKKKVVKLEINELEKDNTEQIVPNSDYVASPMMDVSIKLIGYNDTNEELNSSFADRINNIVDANKSIINYQQTKDIKDAINEDIKKEIKNALNQSYIAETPVNLENDNKARIELSFDLDKSGKSDKYVIYLRKGSTSKEIQGRIVDTGKIEFETSDLGKVVVIGKSQSSDIKGNWAENEIRKLILKYDFSNEIQNGDFRPDDFATVEDGLKFFVNVLYPNDRDENLSLIKKSQKLGLVDGFYILDINKILTKEELAYLASNVYKIETGIELKNIITNNINLNDIDEINPQYRDNILKMIELGITEYSNDKFNPTKKITRAELAKTLVDLLDKINGLN